MAATSLKLLDHILQLRPVTQREAKQFVARNHRHNIASLGSVFQIGLQENGELIGVAMAGMPKARLLMDGYTLEVTRTCVLEDHPNANSMLYGACARAARALGYKRCTTLTLVTESGASLRAVGWERDDRIIETPLNGWMRHNRTSRPDCDMFGMRLVPDGPKYRWWKYL